MPKIKTKKGAAKRLRVTKNGKIKFQRPGKRHRLEQESSKTKRQDCRPGYVAKVDVAAVRQMIPYSF